MNAGPELEEDLQPQASSPAQDNRPGGSKQEGADPAGQSAQAIAMGGQIAERGERLGGGQAADPDGVGKSADPSGADPAGQSAQAIAMGGQIAEGSERLGGGQAADSDGVGKPADPRGENHGVGNASGRRREETVEYPVEESGDQAEQSTQPPAQDKPNGSRETREQPGHLKADKGEKRGGQVKAKRVGKNGKEGGQASGDGRDAAGDRGGQLAQVILLPSAHPNSRAGMGNVAGPENPMPDEAISAQQPVDGQAANWIKSILPESQSGWWEVGAKGRGFAVKFRWRDADRQTLLFPQISGEYFRTLRENSSVEAARILRKRIAANLHTFSLDPAKRDKALIAAEKLGLELSVHLVHSSINREI